MEFGGRYLVRAPRLGVWAALNDAEVLRQCVPGCKRIVWVSDAALEMELSVNLGVAHPTFTGDLELTKVVPAQSYTLTGKGRGGLLGKAHASADITLEDMGEDTVLEFTANGGASGQLMSMGKTLIGSSAQKIIDGFFVRFGEAMGSEVTPLPRKEQ